MTAPDISLVIPVYNRPALITDCLKSLAPSLDHLAEVIVVDDGSTDGQTPQAVQAAIDEMGAGGKIRLIRQKNAGPGAARNTGAAEARGEWLVFFDSDDMWFPWAGRELVAAIRRNPDIVALFMNTHPFADPQEAEGWTDTAIEDIRCATFFELARMRPGPVRVGAGYFAMRRADFLASGGFMPGLRGSEDTDLYYRIAGAGTFLALKHPVLVARRTSNEDSLTLNMAAVAEGMDFMLRGYQEGRYKDPNPGDTEYALGDMLGFWIHELFWRGYGKEGYNILLRRGGFGILMRQGHRVDALKLLFSPLMSVIRPGNHRFGWRPKPKQA